jgi:hypothetical protein
MFGDDVFPQLNLGPLDFTPSVIMLHNFRFQAVILWIWSIPKYP